MTPTPGLVERREADVDRLLDDDWRPVLAAVARGEIGDGIMPGLDDHRRVSGCIADTLNAAAAHIRALQSRLSQAEADLAGARGWLEVKQLLDLWGENWILARGADPGEMLYGCRLMVGEDTVQEGDGDTPLAAVHAAFDAEHPSDAAFAALHSGSLS